MKQHIRTFLYFNLILIYLELIYHGFSGYAFTYTSLYIILGAISFASASYFLCTLWPEKISRVLTAIFTILFCLFFCIQVIYISVFQNNLAIFSMLGVASQAFDFMDVISKNIVANALELGLLLLPIPLFFILNWKKVLSFVPTRKWSSLLGILSCAISYGILILCLQMGSHASYSPYDIYYHNVSIDDTTKEFGILTMTRRDAIYAIFGEPEKTLQMDVVEEEIPEEEKEPEIDTSPNIMEIDFEQIKAAAQNDSVTQLSDYFASQSGTNKNEYTGMFEGYNVIFITAEGFSKYVIDAERTPTLYRLKTEGFNFEHYYTPGWYASTSDGEYANLTGLLPTNGIVSMKRTGTNQNNMYFTLGRQLGRLGYNVNGFHNNSYTYYGRDLSHPNMGYNWYGTGNWFQPETSSSGSSLWPQSDLQLMEQSMDLYMGSEPFHTYYMTVSGHMMYEVNSNQMAARNYDQMANLPYSETTKGYLAANQELEKAMVALIAKLEEKGLAERTVIVLSADHIPYNDKPVCDELAGHTLEQSIEWYENDLLIWSGSMEEPITVDKYCYDVDILPTISNLLGLEYDSRLMIGQDILSDASQLVCFPDRSFISDKCIYNASNGSVTAFDGETISDEYLNEMKNVLYNKFTVSEMILDEDYYKYLPQ